MCCQTCDSNTSEDSGQYGMPVFLSACYCKNESEIGFLAVASSSSWRYQHEFSGETSQFL